MNNIINELKKYDEIYIIGHDNIDADSIFSSYILSKILNNFGINAKFSILDDCKISSQDKKLINDYLKIKPLVLKREDIENKNFILVDHNDIDQSLKNDKCNILFAIDHHIDSKKVKECYTVEYTSTLLYIYSLFKDVYEFNNEEKILIALSVMTDSEYLTSSRFKESDKKLYNELNVSINVEDIRNKYFKTTDFALDIIDNINNNYKFYNVENRIFNRVILKGYSNERHNIKNYLNKMSELYNNTLLIWCEYDTKTTSVYYNQELVKEYDYILTSSVLIIKELMNMKKRII